MNAPFLGFSPFLGLGSLETPAAPAPAPAADVSQIARRLFQLGYFPLPLHPVGSGVQGEGKRPIGEGWQNRAHPSEIDWPAGCNIGIRCDDLLAVDADIADPALAAVAERVLRPAGPLIRYGNRPRFMAIFRAAGGEVFKNWTWRHADGRSFTIQFLTGKGAQFVAWGTHPGTRQLYAWDGPSALDVAADRLPTIDPVALISMLDAAFAPAGFCRNLERPKGEAFDGALTAAMIEDARQRLSQGTAGIDGMLPGTGRGSKAYELGLSVGAVIKAGALDEDAATERLRAAAPDNPNALREFRRGVEASEGRRQTTIAQHAEERRATADQLAAGALATGATGLGEIMPAFNPGEDYASAVKAARQAAEAQRIATEAVFDWLRRELENAARKLDSNARWASFERIGRRMLGMVAAGLIDAKRAPEAFAEVRAKCRNDGAADDLARWIRGEGVDVSAGDRMVEWARQVIALVVKGTDIAEAVGQIDVIAAHRKEGVSLAGAAEQAARMGGWALKGKEYDSKSASNVREFVEAELGLRVRFDNFTRELIFSGGSGLIDTDDLRTLNGKIDDALNRLQTLATSAGTLWADGGWRPSKEMLLSVVRDMGEKDKFDSLVEALGRVPAWDGTPRAATYFGRLLGHAGRPTDAYVNAVGLHMMRGIVARALVPGIKLDEAMVLIGLQGSRKSTLTKLLAAAILSEDAHADSLSPDAEPRQVIIKTKGKLIVELAELTSLPRREVETVKRFMTSQVDEADLKFENGLTRAPRRFVCVGTANLVAEADELGKVRALPPWERAKAVAELVDKADGGFLADTTGNRRFLPVRVLVERIDTDRVAADLPLLYAEVLAMIEAERAAGTLRLVLPEAAAVEAARQQEAHRKVPPYADALGDMLAPFTGHGGWVWASTLREAIDGIRESSPQIGVAMKFHGWETRRAHGGRVRYYFKAGLRDEWEIVWRPLERKFAQLEPAKTLGSAVVLPFSRPAE